MWAMSNGHDNAEKVNHLRRWKAKEVLTHREKMWYGGQSQEIEKKNTYEGEVIIK